MVRLLYAVFVLSGAAGLIYESIWARYLGLFVGHSAYAQVIVLVMFLGGMSIGAVMAGERSERLKSPLLWYAIVELAAGIIGLAFHDAFVAVTTLGYDRVFPALGVGAAQLTVKWLMAALLILPQSLLLGATFPLMTAGVIRLAPERSGRSLAMLYFSNSLGAALGVLVAGFYLVALAGLPGTLIVAAVLNVLVALVVFVVARRATPPAQQIDAFTSETSTGVAGTAQLAPSRMLLLVAFGTAVASFIYEIAWVRMLSLVLGSATHSFELMLSAFILGLSLGAYWIRARVDAGSLRLLAIVQIAMGALAIATLPVYLASFQWMAGAMSVFSRTNEGYQALSVFRYALCLAVMLPATFCAGMTLPLITRLLFKAGLGERAIGRVYGVNTFGSIVGVVVASLVLMPLLGLKWLLVLGGGIDVALGVWLLLTVRRAEPWRISRRMLVGAGLAIAGLLLILGRAQFNPIVLTSGVFRYGRVQGASSADILFYRDGRTASVSIRRSRVNGGVTLATNGKPDASLGPEWLRPHPAGASTQSFSFDASTQTLLALIPLAYAPNARHAAVIGLGSGMTSHMLLGSPTLERLVTVEIEPEMLRAASHFYPANRRVYEDDRSVFAIDDARSYFASGGQTYDVIVAEPSNPWVAGVSGLFTVEFYAALSRYLSDGGVLGQWLHINEIDDGLVLSVVAALARNFASYAIYAISSHDLLIVASKSATLPSPDWSVVQRYEPIAADLTRVHPLSPRTFETLLLADHRSLAPLARHTAPNSDFYPVLDLNAERTRFIGKQATGFGLLGGDRFSTSLAFAGVRNSFGIDERSALVGVPRIDDALTSAMIRGSAPRAGDQKAMDAAFRYQALEQSLASGSAPVDWRAWTRAVSAVEYDLHGGAAGVADLAFYARIDRYLRRTSPPLEARASIEVLRGLATWDFAGASLAAEPLIAKAQRAELWLDPDLLRDGVVTARLMQQDLDGAGNAFRSLALFSRRSPADLRTLLLEALLNSAADSARQRVARR
jgi:spermidine synthase